MGNCAISFNCGTAYNTSLELHEDYITIVQRDYDECEDLISVPLDYVDRFVAALSQVASYDTCDSHRILPDLEVRKATLDGNTIVITKTHEDGYGVDVVVVARNSVDDLIKAFNELTGKNVPTFESKRSEAIYNHVNTLKDLGVNHHYKTTVDFNEGTELVSIVQCSFVSNKTGEYDVITLDSNITKWLLNVLRQIADSTDDVLLHSCSYGGNDNQPYRLKVTMYRVTSEPYVIIENINSDSNDRDAVVVYVNKLNRFIAAFNSNEAGSDVVTLSLDQLTTIQIAMENLYTECSCEEHGTQYIDHLKEILGTIAAIKLNWSSDERYQSIFQPVLLSLPGLSDSSRYLHCTEESPDV